MIQSRDLNLIAIWICHHRKGLLFQGEPSQLIKVGRLSQGQPPFQKPWLFDADHDRQMDRRGQTNSPQHTVLRPRNRRVRPSNRQVRPINRRVRPSNRLSVVCVRMCVWCVSRVAYVYVNILNIFRVEHVQTVAER